MTAKHVIESPLTPQSEHAICFDYDQPTRNYISEYDKGMHRCGQLLYQATPMLVNYASNDEARDPVTGELYSLSNDIASLYVNDN